LRQRLRDAVKAIERDGWANGATRYYVEHSRSG
jgi:hypothetical protein